LTSSQLFGRNWLAFDARKRTPHPGEKS